MNGRVVRAAALSIALIGWSFTAGLDRPWRRHPLTQAAAGTALALAARAPLGLHPAGLRSGVRLGSAAAAGWVFGVLAERSGSLLAPMLAHLAVNEAGAVAALAVQRFARQPRGERQRSEQ